MSDDEKSTEETNTTSSSSSSEDEDDDLNEDFLEKDFLKTLSCLKNKDPQIYDKNVQFFPQGETKIKKEHKTNIKKKDSAEKPIFLRDYERDILTKSVNNESVDHSDQEQPPNITYNEEQRALKESFKNIVNAESSEDEDNSILLKKKEKDEKEKQQEEKDYIQWLKGKRKGLEDKQVENELKPLHDYWNNPGLDEKEEFLKDYILNKRYLERDSQGNIEDSDLSEDEKLLEAQENFEHNYNFRFESEDNKTIKRYPRKIEGSMRRKNDARKRKREEIQKRKKEEKDKKNMEIKKKQKEKLNEIQEKLEKLKEITGNVELGFRDDEIMEDFDPDKYDKKMQELYNDKFYSEEVDGKPDFSNMDSYDNWDPDEINMDCDAEEHSETPKETRSKKKRKKKKTTTYKDICDIVKPVFDPEKHNTFQKYIDEYYNLDCEDFIDDIPCKFKYREVVPNDYGLTVEEILLADDKELNKWVSSKKICKLRPTHVEKNEVKIYKQKSRDEHLKIKLLPSLYQEVDGEEEKGEEEEEHRNQEELTAVQDNVEERTGEEQRFSKKLSKKKNKTHKEDLRNSYSNSKSRLHATKEFKNKFKKYRPNNNDPKDIVNKISDNRLLAYNIKPRQFRAKLKHSKNHV